MATLSISSPGGYHYIIVPTNMAASLTGVGMGSKVPSEDAPLRYEDVAFLMEAYRERRYVFSPSSVPGLEHGVYPLEKNAAVALDIDHDDASVSLAGDYSKTFPQHDLYSLCGYLDPEVEIVADTASNPLEVGNYWDDSGILKTTPLWQAITSGEPPFAQGSVVDFPSQASRTPVRAETVATLYADLGKTTRPCVVEHEVLMSPSATTVESVVTDCLNLILDYDESTGGFIYSEYDGNHTNRSDSGSSAYPVQDGYIYGIEMPIQIAQQISATRKKSRYCQWDSSKKEWVIDTKNEDSYETGSSVSQRVCSGPSVKLIIGRDVSAYLWGFGDLGNRTVKLARVFGYGRFHYGLTVTRHGVREKKESMTKRFLLELGDAEYEGRGVVSCQIGSAGYNEGLLQLLNKRFKCSSPAFSGDELLEETEKPDDLPQRQGYHEATENRLINRSVTITDFFVVLDVDFNARLLTK